MNEKIQAYLDGELSASELTAEERVEVLRAETASIPLADLTPPVMERISALPDPMLARSRGDVPGWKHFIRWFADPFRVSFSLRPIYAIAAAFLVLAVSSQFWPIASPADLSNAETRAEAPPQAFVRFQVMVPEAREVRLAGSFTNWEPSISLRQHSPGLWTALVPLTPGVHDYAFRVDGERWVIDPAAARVADGFGGYNSQLSVILASN